METKKILLCFVLFFCISSFAYSQWVLSGTVTMSGSYPSISVANPNVIWIVGGANTPVIFKSTNGGTNWVSVPVTGLPAKALMCVWAIDDMTAFVGDGGDAPGQTGGDAAVSKTTNGGTTWTTIFNTGGSAGFFNGIVFSRSNPMIGIAESDPPAGTGQAYYLQKTTNGGVNWTLSNPPGVSGQASAQNSIVIIDNMFYGWGLNTTAGARLTSNGGTSWFTGTLGITGTFVAGMAFHDNKLFGVASTSNSFPNIARTTNGGTTWSPVNVGGTGTTTLSVLKWIDNSNTCYYNGSMSAGLALRKSTNSGLNWTTMTAPTGANFTHFDFVRVGTTVTGFAIAPTGMILKLTESVTLISTENSLIPSEYILKQNYPNPFNPSTTISFSIPKTEFVTLKIYDAIGKEVRTIVNEKLEAGNYKHTFEKSSDMTSGIYFYKITAGNYTDTKKMILVK
jgi:photosystem II stability/assembly factor-like uncharacterized protein